MDGVVVVDPRGDEPERCDGVGQWRDADVVALEGFHEGLSHPVALGRADGLEAGHETELACEVTCLSSGVTRAVIAEVLDVVWGARHGAGEFGQTSGRDRDPITSICDPRATFELLRHSARTPRVADRRARLDV